MRTFCFLKYMLKIIWSVKLSDSGPSFSEIISFFTNGCWQVQLIDSFTNEKKGMTSHCYRIAYRSMERSLTDEEINDLQVFINFKLYPYYVLICLKKKFGYRLHIFCGCQCRGTCENKFRAS